MPLIINIILVIILKEKTKRLPVKLCYIDFSDASVGSVS